MHVEFYLSRHDVIDSCDKATLEELEKLSPFERKRTFGNFFKDWKKRTHLDEEVFDQFVEARNILVHPGTGPAHSGGVEYQLQHLKALAPMVAG
jgi:hypothetical protein